MSYFRFLLVLIIVVLIVHEGKALKCWICHSNSPDAAGCSDPFLGSPDNDNMFIRECEKVSNYLQFLPNGTTHNTRHINPGLDFFCYKLVGKSLGVKLVMRGCSMGLPNISKGSCMYAEPDKTVGGNILTCDTCAGDLCNGATGVGAVAVLVAPLLLLLT